MKHPTFKCWQCDEGMYSDVDDAESCTPCPEGYSTHTIGETSCTCEKRLLLKIFLIIWILSQLFNKKLFC